MAIARRLALGRLISLTGGSAAFIALTATIYDETGSAAWLSAALFAGVVGTVVAAPFSGWLGDRYDRRRVLIAADLAAAAVSLASRERSTRGARRAARALGRGAGPVRARVGRRDP